MSKCQLLNSESAKQLLSTIDNVMFDCDGVLWNGPDGFPGSKEVVEQLKKMGKRVFFVTNNSTKSRREYVQKFTGLGYSVKETDVICTAYVTARYLHDLDFKGKVYLIGSSGIAEELDNFGIRHTEIGPDMIINSIMEGANVELDPEVRCVLVGFDPHISYIKILKAASYLNRSDCLFVASDDDPYFRTRSAIILPGTGTMVACVKTASTREPVVMGKPHPPIFNTLIESQKLDPARTLMVGDRLDTDIALAHNCGLISLLVLTGVASLEQAKKCSNPAHVPDFYLPSLGDMQEFLPS